eukprot:7132591-Lingulodinium_polyedra.AAC.1
MRMNRVAVLDAFVISSDGLRKAKMPLDDDGGEPGLPRVRNVKFESVPLCHHMERARRISRIHADI